MKALCMVAHPDDCVIFALSFIEAYRKLDWTIVYLTYDQDHPRAKEFRNFWNRKQIKTQFLGYNDDYRDLESNHISFDTAAAKAEIEQLVKQYDAVLTHASDGDYGHLHHAFVHDSVYSTHDHVVTFAAPNKGTHTFDAPPDSYHAKDFPLHWDIIQGFHRENHRNSYFMKRPTEHRLSQ